MRCERREKHGDPNNMTIPGWRSADVRCCTRSEPAISLPFWQAEM